MLYLAVDGVAPRAKMNQQRSRRFRAAKEAEMAAAERVARSTVQMEQQLVSSSGGSSSSSGQTFDSNCITPGTDFMIKLSIALQKWVAYKQETDEVWKNGADVIVSGPDVPGEGEHKVMDFIRDERAKNGTSPYYQPNMVHILYGTYIDRCVTILVKRWLVVVVGCCWVHTYFFLFKNGHVHFTQFARFFFRFHRFFRFFPPPFGSAF
jgi:5'-3' exoribonuclease 2